MRYIFLVICLCFVGAVFAAETAPVAGDEDLRATLERVEGERAAAEKEKQLLVEQLRDSRKREEAQAKLLEKAQGTPAAFASLQGKVNELQVQLEAVARERDDFRQRLDQSRLRNSAEIMEEIRETPAGTAPERKSDLFKTLEQDRSKVEEKLQKARISLEEEKNRREQAENVARDLGKKANELEDKVKGLEKTLAETMAEAEKKGGDAQALVSRLQEAESEVKPTLEKYADLHERFENLQVKLRKIEDMLKDALRRAEIAEAEKAQGREKVERKMDKLKAYIDLQNRRAVRLYYNLGVLHFQEGEYKKAETQFLEALKIDPDDGYTHYNLGVLYDEKLNNKAFAAHYYREFVRLMPEAPEAMHVKEWQVAAEESSAFGKKLK
jgi:tetratricopeptide (TPR) repeat protein